MFELYTPETIRQHQRTAKGLQYERTIQAHKQNRMSRDKNVRDALKRQDAFVLSMKDVNPGAVHSNTFLSNLSVQYANDEYIGDRLMPFLPVGKRSDVFAKYDKRDRFAAPDDALGTRATPNEISEGRSSDNYSVRDYGLMNFVDQQTVQNQDAPFDEMVDLVESIAELIALNREIRLASILTTAGNFAGNTVTLSGASQWSAGGGGDPVKNIQDAIAALWMGRGPSDIWGYCSLDVINTLARHPQIRELFKYTAEGLAKPAQIAGFFGLAGILVGAARKDTANSGQTASYSRVWGKHFGIVRVSRRASLRNAAFGYTIRLREDPMTTQWFDQKPGKSGGYYAKIAVSEDHKVIAGDTGYLIVDAVA